MLDQTSRDKNFGVGRKMQNAIPGARYTTFRELFKLSGTNDPVRFSIPQYQRSYDWRTEHRRDLFNDLERLAAMQHDTTGDPAQKGLPNTGHFCGTVICTPIEGEPAQFDVVDGQQRLTTLVMLDVLLARHVKTQPCVINNGQSLFIPQGSDHGYFKQIIHPDLSGGAQKATQAQQNYADAKVEIESWITSLIDRPEYDPAQMLRLVEQRLQVILFILADTNEVSKVFETINNRGKPLTQMDLVKNHLIYLKAVNNWDDDVNATWQAIQRTTKATTMRGTESSDTVLRAVVNAMFKPGKRKAGDTDYKIIKTHLHDAEAFTRFLSFLKSAFDTFKRLRAAVRTDQRNHVDTQLTYLNLQPNVAGVLPLIFVRQWIQKDGEGEASVLEAIEKANFRLYGLPNSYSRSDSYNVPLYTLANAYLYQARDVDGDASEQMEVSTGGQQVRSNSVVDMLTGIVSAQQKNGLRHIVDGLTLGDDDGFDFYNWDTIRYFLARWEEDLLNKQSFNYSRLHRRFHDSLPNDYLAREHIIPQSSPGPISDYNDSQQLRRLGNFMLLSHGVNAALSNRPLKEKLKVLKAKSGETVLLLQNGQLHDYAKKAIKFRKHLERRNDKAFGGIRERFNLPTIEKEGDLVTTKTLCDLREEDMIRFALKTWRLPGEAAVDQAFFGLFSFSTDGEAYKSDDETPAKKPNANFILDTFRSKPHRLMQRNKKLGRTFDPVSWGNE